eukprot:gene10047-20927_t
MTQKFLSCSKLIIGFNEKSLLDKCNGQKSKNNSSAEDPPISTLIRPEVILVLGCSENYRKKKFCCRWKVLVASTIVILFVAHIPLSVSESDISTDTQPDGSRPQSMFKVGPGSDDWLALPEVFSNLDFAADNSPVNDEDIEGQKRLRSTRFWGRLYIDGWPQTIQYFRAHFGIEPPLGRKIFVFAEPRDACEELTNGKLLTSDHVLLVNRGTCTFGTKAKHAHNTNATGLIIINNEPGIDHLPGPDAHDIQFSVVSIAQQEGQLLEATYDDGPIINGFGRVFEGYIVPINCQTGHAKCTPATVEERKNIQNLTEGGFVTVESSSKGKIQMEYLIAHFGTRVPHESKSYPLVTASPSDACDPIVNDIKGKVVLVTRGTCAFVKKAEHIQAAGAAVLIVGSLNDNIVRMGLNTIIPVTMVSKRAFSLLTTEAEAQVTVSFSENITVSASVWENLEKLSSGEGWPRSDTYITKKYSELKEEYKDWPDSLDESYKLIKREDNGASGAVKSEL